MGAPRNVRAGAADAPQEGAGPSKRRRATRAENSAAVQLVGAPAVAGGAPLAGSSEAYLVSEKKRKEVARQMALNPEAPVPGADVITRTDDQLSLGFFPFKDPALAVFLGREDVKGMLGGPLSTLVAKQGSADGGRPLLESPGADKAEKKLALFKELRKHTLAAAYRGAEACEAALAALQAKGGELTPAAAQLQRDVAAALKQPRTMSWGREVLGSKPLGGGPSEEQAAHTDGPMLSAIMALWRARPPPLVVSRGDGQCSQRTIPELGDILRRCDPDWEVDQVAPILGQERMVLTGALLSDQPRLASMGPVMRPGDGVLVARDTPHAGSMVPEQCLSEFIGLCGDRPYRGSDNKPSFHIAALVGADRTAARLLMKDVERLPSFLLRYKSPVIGRLKTVNNAHQEMADARAAAAAAAAAEPDAEATSAAWREALAKEGKYLKAARQLAADLRNGSTIYDALT